MENFLNKKIIFLVIFYFLVGFSLFGNNLNGNFVYDDNIILSNSRFNHPETFLTFFTEPYFENFPEGGLYRPLTLISFIPNFLLGNAPNSFHFLNILIHILNSVLSYLLIFHFTKSFKTSFLTATLFLVLPVHVEAVSSIVGRAELLSFLFSSIALFAWLKSKFFLSAVFFLAALFSKETAVVLPIILCVMSAYNLSGPIKVRFQNFISINKKWLCYFSIAVLCYFIFRLNALDGYIFRPQVEFVFNPLVDLSWIERAAAALKILVLYLQKIFIPFRLSPDYSFNQIQFNHNAVDLSMTAAGFSFLLLSFIFIGKAIYKKCNIAIVFGLIMFIFPFLIISNIIWPTGTIMADRLMYWPSLGVILLVVILLEKIKQRKRLLIKFLFIFITALFSVFSFFQNKIWANEQNLFSAMRRNSPDSLVAKTNWARILFDRGQSEAAKSLLLETIGEFPDFNPALNLLARIYKNENLKKSEEFFERALILKPLNEETLIGLSRIYFIEKKYRQAEHILDFLVFKYGGTGNILLLASAKIKSGNFWGGKRVVIKYFGAETNDESARSIINFADFKLGYLNTTPKKRDAIEEDFYQLTSLFAM